MQNWILMAQNHKGQNLRACSQIADENIPSQQAAQLLADKLELEDPGFGLPHSPENEPGRIGKPGLLAKRMLGGSDRV